MVGVLLILSAAGVQLMAASDVLPRGDNSFQKSRHAWLSRDLARAAAAAPAAETPEGQSGENLMHGGGGQEGRGDARRGWAGAEGRGDRDAAAAASTTT